MDVFDWIMDFMRINGFKPSKSLREEYSKSEFNKKLLLPSFKVLNEKIGMTKEVYDKLEERYNSKGAFNYFFNPNIDIQMRVKSNKNGNMFLAVGHFNKETEELIGAGMKVRHDGYLQQGYFKDNKREYYGRFFFSNGEFCEGGFRQDKRHGHGEYQWSNGDIYIGEWKDGEKNGNGEKQYKNGNMYKGQWMNDKRHGKGVYMWKDGAREVAEYVNDKKHGPAQFYDADGKICNRIYMDGVKLNI